MAGVILFNFAYTVTVPAWLNEKKAEVSVNKTIWCVLTYISMYVRYRVNSGNSMSLMIDKYVLFSVMKKMNTDQDIKF